MTVKLTFSSCNILQFQIIFDKTVLQVRSIQSDHDDLVAQNKSLAEYNLSLQPRLDSLKTEVATGYESINKLKNELGMAKARLGNLANLCMDTF